MQVEDSDRIVHEIIGDICNREDTGGDRPERTTDADFRAGFEMLIHDDDDVDKAIMRRIMQELAVK